MHPYSTGKEKGLDPPPSWRDLLLFDLFLLALLILAARLATFLHEFAGHSLMTLAFGGQIKGIRITLLGGGEVYWHFTTSLALTAGFLVAFGGIIVNLLSGLLPFKLCGRLENRPAWALFLIVFAMVSLLGAFAYAALGFYYDVGDPVSWMEGPSPKGGLLWIPFVVIFPVASFFTVRAFSILLQRYFPAKTFPGKIGILLLTLGVSGSAYAGLYVMTRQRSLAMDTPLLAYERAEREVLEEKKDRLFRSLRKSRPELSAEEVRRMVARTPIRVRPEEVPERVPLRPVLGLLFALGALFALKRAKADGSLSRAPVDLRATTLAVVLALAVLAVLAWTGGWVYGPG
jgi:hypothetical protein